MKNLNLLQLTPVGIYRRVNPRGKEVERKIQLVFLCIINRGGDIRYVLIRHPWDNECEADALFREMSIRVINPRKIHRYSMNYLHIEELIRTLQINIGTGMDVEDMFLNDSEYLVLNMLMKRRWKSNDEEYIDLSVEEHEKENLSYKEIESLRQEIIHHIRAYGLDFENINLVVGKLSKIDISNRLEWDKVSSGTESIFLPMEEIEEEQ